MEIKLKEIDLNVAYKVALIIVTMRDLDQIGQRAWNFHFCPSPPHFPPILKGRFMHQ